MLMELPSSCSIDSSFMKPAAWCDLKEPPTHALHTGKMGHPWENISPWLMFVGLIKHGKIGTIGEDAHTSGHMDVEDSMEM